MKPFIGNYDPSFGWTGIWSVERNNKERSLIGYLTPKQLLLCAPLLDWEAHVETTEETDPSVNLGQSTHWPAFKGMNFSYYFFHHKSDQARLRNAEDDFENMLAIFTSEQP